VTLGRRRQGGSFKRRNAEKKARRRRASQTISGKRASGGGKEIDHRKTIQKARGKDNNHSNIKKKRGDGNRLAERRALTTCLNKST